MKIGSDSLGKLLSEVRHDVAMETETRGVNARILSFVVAHAMDANVVESVALIRDVRVIRVFSSTARTRMTRIRRIRLASGRFALINPVG